MKIRVKVKKFQTKEGGFINIKESFETAEISKCDINSKEAYDMVCKEIMSRLEIVYEEVKE